MPFLTHDERVGTLLGGKYRLGRLAGRGGMGAVFEGRHEWTGRPVAVKILNQEYVDNAEVADRFLREARVAAEVKHPHVVDVLDMGEDDDRTVYMVLELLEGETLSRLLTREAALPFSRAAELLLPVMRAVAHAHAHNVVHRDIKPENIFIHHDAAGQTVPKILDFGIAKVLDERNRSRVTEAGYVMGTPMYMSPEQANGVSDRLGPPADVWSMGVIWYEALTGAMPFDGPSPIAILVAVNRGEYTPFVERLPALPGAVTRVLDRALAHDPKRRYADMGAFLDALQEAVAASRGSQHALEVQPGELDDRASVLPFEGRVSLADALDVNGRPRVLVRKVARRRRSFPLFAALVAALACVTSAATLLGHARAPVIVGHSALLVAATAIRPTPAPRPASRVSEGVSQLGSAADAAPILPAPLAARRAPSPPARRAAAAVKLTIRPPATPATPATVRRAIPLENAPFTDYDAVP